MREGAISSDQNKTIGYIVSTTFPVNFFRMLRCTCKIGQTHGFDCGFERFDVASCNMRTSINMQKMFQTGDDSNLFCGKVFSILNTFD